jgi:hypothetical protein
MARKTDFCKRGLIAIYEYCKMENALLASKLDSGIHRPTLEESEWIPMTLEAKRISKTSDLLKLKRKELEALVDSVRNKISLSWFHRFSREVIDNTRYF